MVTSLSSLRMATSSSSSGGDFRVKTRTGETYIAASQRADGSWRKPRKVKSGYVPQDEQPKYESKGKQATAGGDVRYPIGMTPVQMVRESEQTKQRGPIAAVNRPNAPVTPQDHVEKKIEGLRKKLREIDVLEKKIADGELANPEKTQLDKIGRRSAIEDEIGKLVDQLAAL